MTISEDWDVDRLVNQKLCLPAQLPLHHDGPVQRLHYCRRHTNPAVDLNRYPVLKDSHGDRARKKTNQDIPNTFFKMSQTIPNIYVWEVSTLAQPQKDCNFHAI